MCVDVSFRSQSSSGVKQRQNVLCHHPSCIVGLQGPSRVCVLLQNNASVLAWVNSCAPGDGGGGGGRLETVEMEGCGWLLLLNQVGTSKSYEFEPRERVC